MRLQDLPSVLQDMLGCNECMRRLGFAPDEIKGGICRALGGGWKIIVQVTRGADRFVLDVGDVDARDEAAVVTWQRQIVEAVDTWNRAPNAAALAMYDGFLARQPPGWGFELSKALILKGFIIGAVDV